MKRNTLNLFVDLLSALVVLGITATGLIVRFVLPPGSGRGRILWTWDRHEWGNLHFWLAVAAGVLLLVHVTLHWQWICVTMLRLFRRSSEQQVYPRGIARNLAGVALVAGVIGLFGGFVWFAEANVKGNSEGREHRGRDESVQVPQDSNRWEQEPQSIRGSMSLSEVAVASGVPVDQLREKPGLRASVSVNERLGRLRQQYGFTMDQVRQVVAAAQKEAGSSATK
ncbi:MAG: DUF4405 domain-containing protein [Bacillota bacterium]